ncbi:unnamed protein product [Trichobilharzia regenti]|nr:unnamed protein product [Trichobilharzia regenti]
MLLWLMATIGGMQEVRFVLLWTHQPNILAFPVNDGVLTEARILNLSIPALLQWLFPEMRIIPLVPSNDNTTAVDSNDSNLTNTNTTTTTTTTMTTTLTTAAAAVMNSSSTTTTTTTTPSSIEIENTTSPFIPLGPQSFQWECVFMPDNGAFFVNYVITAAFIGTALELVRFSELVNYACRLMCVKSGAEKGGVRKASQFEFEFGLFYAWSLCVFAVICAYSILCPLITPFVSSFAVCEIYAHLFTWLFEVHRQLSEAVNPWPNLDSTPPKFQSLKQPIINTTIQHQRKAFKDFIMN